MRRLSLGIILLLLSVPFAVYAKDVPRDGTFWIEATGAVPANGKSNSRARVEALSEALLMAGFSAGAQVRGYTYVDKARVIADRMMMRPTGRVYTHKILSEGKENGLYVMRIKALVGPDGASFCSDRRVLRVTAFPSKVNVDPHAPAWVTPLAQKILNNMLERIAEGPNTVLEQVSPTPVGGIAKGTRALFDYQTLTRGSVVMRAGDHQFSSMVNVSLVSNGVKNQVIVFNVKFKLLTQAGTSISKEFSYEAKVNKMGGIVRLASKNKVKLADELMKLAQQNFDALLGQATCDPANARLVVSGDKITVPLGSAHGITKSALAFVKSRGALFEAFEITSLNERSAELRLIGSKTNLSKFNGVLVHFMEVGL